MKLVMKEPGSNLLTNDWQNFAMCAVEYDIVKTLQYGTNTHEGDQYGPRIRAEADAYIVVKEGYVLIKVKKPRGVIFDAFSQEVKHNAKDGDA